MATDYPKADAKASKTDDKALLERARKQFRAIVDAESKLREEMLEDRKFRAGIQWAEKDRKAREEDGRPCLTINRIPQFIRLITNQQRQSRPAVQVNPVDSGGDKETAEVFQGLIRHIETASDAEVAYDTACEHQVEMGRGYLRVLTEYANDTGGEQNIRIERVLNPFSVYIDQAARKADRSDMRFAFITTDLPKDEYEELYGEKSSVESLEEFAATGDESAQDWMPEGKVRVAEYFCIKHKESEIQVGDRKRKVQTPEVYWYLINAVSVLERRQWAGKFIPIVPVLGDEIDINGVIDLRGVVRDGRDPQRMCNFWESMTAETILSSNLAPWVMAEGQDEGYEKMWDTANRKRYSRLVYKPTTVAGQLAAPPRRETAEPPIQAMVLASQQAKADLQDVTGLQDDAHGKRGPSESGKAILARQQQGDLSNSHYLDNLGRSIRHLGRMLVDLIPHYYDAPRVVRILGEDEKEQTVMVAAGQQNVMAAQQQGLPEGVKRIYDLSAGHFDVTISVGPSNQTRRQEAVESMVRFVEAYPNAFPLIGDLLADEMDWPGAAAIAKRLKAMVPPQALGEDGDPASQLAAANVQMQQMDGAIQQMQAQLEEAKRIIQSKQVEAQTKVRVAEIEAATKQAIAEMEARLALMKESGKQEAENARTGAKIAAEAESERVRLLAEAAMADAERITKVQLSERQAEQPNA